MEKMRKLLVITQKVDRNDPVLGFFHRWLEEFAKNVERLTVICLEKGDYNLPENVKVLSLGKEVVDQTGYGPFWTIPRLVRRFVYLIRFYKYIWAERKNYDDVFVHMNPEYVILGWADWKILGKRVALWYVHKAVNRRLWMSEKLVDKIFTASAESFRLLSKKVEIVGHGIDLEKFKIQNSKIKITSQNSKLTILTAGRIAPVKNLELLVEAIDVLSTEGGSTSGGKNYKIDFSVEIAGGPATSSDKIYFEKLKSLVKEKGLENLVSFVGPVPYSEIQNFYVEGDIFVNLSETGSVDKAVLEAMASGLSVITSNEAFKNILPPKYFLSQKSSEKLAQKIIEISKELGPKHELREIVVQNHSLEGLIKKILENIIR